jgi:hypothetical protein
MSIVRLERTIVSPNDGVPTALLHIDLEVEHLPRDGDVVLLNGIEATVYGVRHELRQSRLATYVILIGDRAASRASGSAERQRIFNERIDLHLAAGFVL